MKTAELIEVYIDTEFGKTVCICKRDNKGCNRNCEADVVERDKFRGWEKTLQRNRFGKSP